MSEKNKCRYIYAKGDKAGKQCETTCKNEYCSKHKKNNEVKKDDEDLVSIVDNETESKKESSVFSSSDITSNEDILLTKYFVYDCIRDFLREHREVSDILNPVKKSESSNMSSMLMMAGVGILPMIMKNYLTFPNIGNNAIHKQENINGPCDTRGIHEGKGNQDNTIETNPEHTKKTESFTENETREDNTTQQTIIKRDQFKC